MLVLTALIRRDERSQLFDALRGAATFYIPITCVVFALLLSGLQEDLDTHIAFIELRRPLPDPDCSPVRLVHRPAASPTGTRIAVAWLAYPLAWFVYTLVRGRARDWYPYPFVDVTQHGYGGVLARGVIFVLAFAIGAAGFAMLSDRRSSSVRSQTR